MYCDTSREPNDSSIFPQMRSMPTKTTGTASAETTAAVVRHDGIRIRVLPDASEA
jgi:hypothetical protein